MEASSRRPRERHGLFLLHEPPGDAQDCKVDIIALHGLGGDAYKTWSDQDGHLWLRDSLPAYVPQARIATYGYDSAVVFSSSRMHLDDFALGLLSSLDYERRDHSARKRPIIFVCHSLGGLLFKQVLISGILAGPEYKDLVDSIRGVIFMGTPHRGSNSASYATILSKILNVPTFGRGIRSDLLTLLKTSSPTLSQITQQSKNLLKPLSVISFYEQQPLGPTLIVEPFSAVLGLPNERTIPINRDHRQIAKVSPRNQQHFNIVKNVVMDLVNQCISEENTDMCKSLLDKLYCFDYRSTQLRPRQPHAETCKWLFQHETFHGWSIAEQSSLLVLSGPPGTGKSVLARHLVEQIESGSDDTPLADDFKVVSFFCSYDPSGATTAETVLRSILHQLLQLLPQAQTIVRNSLETRTGHSITIHTESNYVWRAIADVLAMQDGSKCIIVLDAIDELSANDGLLLLAGFSQTIQDINRLQPRHQVKVFVSARIDLAYLSETVEDMSIFTINLSNSPNCSGVERYVKACIHDFEKECKGFADSLDNSDKQQIVKKISSRASGMFLWAEVAWKSFIKGVLWNKEQVRKKLTQLDFNPAGIDKLYEKMLERVASHLRQDMWAVFRILVTAQRPLRDTEIAILLSLIMSDEVPSTSENIDLIRNVGGSILRNFPEFVVQQCDGTLTFVHLSFNQYLENLWTRKYPKWLNRAHCQMARSCLDYLELEDLIQHADKALTKDLVVAFPFLEYAAKYYFAHLCETDHDDDIWLQYAAMGSSTSIFAVPRFAGSALPGSSYMSPLNAIVETLCSSKLVRKFHQNGYDLDDKWNANTDELSAVYQCAFQLRHNKHKAMLLLLLELGANPNGGHAWIKNTVLQIVIREQDWATYQIIVENPKTDLNRQSRSGRAALHTLVEFGTESALDDFLVNRVFDVNIQDNMGYTALHLAVFLCKLDCTKKLVRVPGIRTDILDQQGRTPLALATFWGHFDAARVLIGATAELLPPEPEQLSPLICAFMQQDRILSDMLLNQYGFSGLAKHMDHSGKGVLHHAAENDWPDVIDACITGCCDGNILDQIDHSGRTALHYAASYGHTSCCKILKSHGASTLAQDRNGRTAAQAALDMGFKDTIMLLLEYADVDANQRDHQGRNLVHWAASLDCLDVMEKVTGFPGVDLCRRDNMSLMPIDVAYRCRCARVGQFLSDQMHMRFPSLSHPRYPWDLLYQSPTINEVNIEDDYWKIEDRDKELQARESRRSKVTAAEQERIYAHFPPERWAVVPFNPWPPTAPVPAPVPTYV